MNTRSDGKIARTVEEALAMIDAEFTTSVPVYLAVADSLNDPGGINMAIITDKILGAGLLPDGFEQKDGYRIYKYTKMVTQQ